MSARQNYQSLVDKYKSSNQFIKKLGLYGMVLQICIITVIVSWKHGGIGHYVIGGSLLFALSIYLLVKDFITLLRIEKSMMQMIVEGVNLEAQNPVLGRFFLGILQSFKFLRVLITRSLVNALATGCLGYLILEFIRDVHPGVTVSHWLLNVFAWISGAVTCKLYHDSLKDLEGARERALVKQSI